MRRAVFAFGREPSAIVGSGQEAAAFVAALPHGCRILDLVVLPVTRARGHLVVFPAFHAWPLDPMCAAFDYPAVRAARSVPIIG